MLVVKKKKKILMKLTDLVFFLSLSFLFHCGQLFNFI